MTIATTTPAFLRSPAMQFVVEGAELAVASPAGVLICGEPGTGRERLARALHLARLARNGIPWEDLFRRRRSADDSGAPFVVIDCANSREIEQHVFGRSTLSATGSDLERISPDALLYNAFGGTLFLRSVHDMPGRLQARLARMLRDGEVWIEDRRGVSTVATLDIRVIASIDVTGDAADGRVVPELEKRLATHRIELPPLRQRREDIPGLVRLLFAEICESLRIPTKTASSQAVALLCALPWRGNVTELRGLLRTLVLKVPGRMIRLADVLDNVRLDGGAVMLMGGGTLKEARERFEREYVAAVLEQHQGRMAEAARVLGIQRTNLYRKVRQLSVRRKSSGARRA